MSAGKLMKGHTWAKGKHKLHYPATAECKLDEIRLDVRIEHDEAFGHPGYSHTVFRSYADKPLHNLSQWEEQFRAWLSHFKRTRLDMGVLVNESFNDTYRWTRSSKGVPADLHGAELQFILFDMPELGLIPYKDRAYHLDAIAEQGRSITGLDIIRPMRRQVYHEDDVLAAYDTAVTDGFEGLMVKSHDHIYELDKRSYGWLKVKPEEDADGIITAINQAHSLEGVPLDRAGSVTITCADGSTADCAGISHDLGRIMLADPEQFIGKWATFTYMMRDRQGGYRHPRFQRIREDKE